MTPFQQWSQFILFNQWQKYIKRLFFKKERGTNRTKALQPWSRWSIGSGFYKSVLHQTTLLPLFPWVLWILKEESMMLL